MKIESSNCTDMIVQQLILKENYEIIRMLYIVYASHYKAII